MLQPQKAGLAAIAGNGEMIIADAMRAPLRAVAANDSELTWRDKLSDMDLAPDLGEDIGSLRWFRGLGTFAALVALALALLPDFAPLYGMAGAVPTEAEFEESRAQMIMPLALGSDSGKKMAATDAVIALAASPERPSITLMATLGRGDSFARVLQRAGVGRDEAARVTSMVSGAADLGAIAPGTQMQVVLGKRSSRNAARPLDALSFRARFDLNLAVNRVGGALQLKRLPIMTDDTPLRIRGQVGSSLYKSARAAGAPADAIQNFLKVISGQINLSNLQSSDEFDIIVDYRRAETGEVEVGDLLYAGIDSGGKSKVQMLKWTSGGSAQWFEASGVGKTRGELGRPVNGRMTSGYGMRRHPILGYRRMHAGVDFGAPHGAPIYAVTDGVISYAGRKGGNGNYVQIRHSGGLASGYSHLSRIAARNGQRVRRGQVIGYVGSTGLSTGPHLHYSLYRNNRAINPLSIKFTETAQLAGADLANFRAKLARLKAVKPGAALTSLRGSNSQADEPKREIDRLTMSVPRNSRI
ncbi:M23 family metallopeptidase [Sphingorhabdus arenilitoris]|uniref:M23 family metallopeptidase n=1 Tax=Sphingorhabdus arenilitoris TaxID=1490041 RepID=A0ABV8REQ0_9SPHN